MINRVAAVPLVPQFSLARQRKTNNSALLFGIALLRIKSRELPLSFKRDAGCAGITPVGEGAGAGRARTR